jgi:integrase
MTTEHPSESQSQQSKRQRAKRQAWPPIYKRTHRSGQVGYLVDLGLVNGERVRKTFPSKQEAETFAAQARMARENEGVAAFSLATETRAEAVKCLELLEPYGAGLTEAVQYYVNHVLRFREAPTVAEIIQRMVADAKSLGRRAETVRELRNRLGRFALLFGTRRLSTITLPELEGYLSNAALSARTRVNDAVKVSQLYNFAIRHSWVDANLAEKVVRPTPDDKEPAIFKPAQTAKVLEHAPEFDLLPYVVLGLFAGLRPTETQRLDWSAVKLGERSIIIGAEVAKKRMRRVVEINETLAAWLAPYAKERGPVVEQLNFRKRLDALRVASKVEPWPANGFRHSFGTYHLAAHGDAIKTAGLMGHRDPGVLHNHYKALVTKAEAEHFWALRPTGEAGKVVPMSPDSGHNAPATATEVVGEKARQEAHS